jgi:hypothetical protein
MDIFQVLLITAFVQTFAAGQCHVAKCLKEIARRHFTPGVTLVTVNSCHEQHRNDSEPQHKFLSTTDGASNLYLKQYDSISSALEELNRQQEWPILVYSTCYEAKHGTKGKLNNYVLLLTTPDLIRELRNQLVSLKDSPEWNPRANFVVTLAKSCLPPVKQSGFVDEILTELFSWNIVKVIVLVPTHTSLLQSTGNEITGAPSKMSISKEFLHVLEAWVPRQTPANCSQDIKATLINVWVSDGENGGNFLHDIPLYEQKVLGNFHGCPLRVSAFDYSPFFIQDFKSRKGNDAISFEDGLEFRLLNTITSATNMSVAFDPVPAGGDLWGKPLKNGSWSGMLGRVLGGTSDVAMCSAYHTSHVSNYFEWSTPYIFDNSLWCVPCPKTFPSSMSLTRVFQLDLWLVFILAYIIYSTVMWVLVTLNNIHGHEELSYTSVSKCFLNMWAVILGVSVHEKIPKKSLFRTSFVLWLVYSSVLNTVYQAFLTTFLVEPGFEHEITTENDLLESGMEIGLSATIDSVLPDLKTERYSRYTRCTNMSSCFHRLAFEGNFAVLCYKYKTEYDVVRNYTDSRGKPLVCQLHEVFSLQLVTLMVRKGSLFLDKFNMIVTHVLEAGLMDLWWKDLKYKASLSAAADFIEGYSKRTVTLVNLHSAFSVLVFGLILATLCFVWERFHRVACLTYKYRD